MPSIITASTASNTALNFSADTSGVLEIRTGSSPTTAMTIDGSQNVGIGTASPSTKLEVNGNIKIGGSSGSNYLYTTSTGGNLGIQVNNGAIQFLRNNGNNEAMRINAGTNILCLAGGNTSATGTGIAFPASQDTSSDANTLDDYEEGTWTPTVSSGGVTFSVSGAQYIKIGRSVTVFGWLEPLTSGNTNPLVIGGLPFGSSNVSFAVGTVDNMQITNNNYCRVNQNSSSVSFFYSNAGSRIDAPGNLFNSYMIFSITYLASS